MAQSYFAVITPGLEGALVAELRRMKVKKPSEVKGGVEFQATRRGFYEAVRDSRSANRLYRRVADFRARDVQELFKKTRRIAWEELLDPAAGVLVEATSRRSKLNGTGQISGTVLDGIRARFESDPASRSLNEAASKPPVVLLARMADDRCTLSLSADPRALYLRGWRTEAGGAPLRETTSCALLELVGWRPGTPLLDPMCGSGTFLIEAARASANLPPRIWETHGFESWAAHDAELYAEILASREEASSVHTQLWGYDRDAEMIALSQRNALRAGVAEQVTWRAQGVAALERPDGEPGVVISNPPYGKRLAREGKRQPADRVLLERFAETFEGWVLGLLLPSDHEPAHPSLLVEELARFRNGGTAVRLWRVVHAPKS
ncbi:MAG: hypothetical protein AAGI01_04590 [Myxococcota bacterium]